MDHCEKTFINVSEMNDSNEMVVLMMTSFDYERVERIVDTYQRNLENTLLRNNPSRPRLRTPKPKLDVILRTNGGPREILHDGNITKMAFINTQPPSDIRGEYGFQETIKDMEKLRSFIERHCDNTTILSYTMFLTMGMTSTIPNPTNERGWSLIETGIIALIATIENHLNNDPLGTVMTDEEEVAYKRLRSKYRNVPTIKEEELKSIHESITSPDDNIVIVDE